MNNDSIPFTKMERNLEKWLQVDSIGAKGRVVASLEQVKTAGPLCRNMEFDIAT